MSEIQTQVAQEHETFELAELEDEQQILAEIRGRTADKLIYSFEQGGKTLEGLSYSGVNWACREYAKRGEVIRIVGTPTFTVDPTSPEHILAVCQAQRFAIDPETGREIALDNTFGVKRRWSKMQLRDGRVIPDPHIFEKALSMSQRNAKKALLPTDFVIEVLKRIKAGKTGEEPRKATAKPQKPAGPLKAPDEAQSTVGAAPEAPSAPQAPAPGRDMGIGPRVHMNLKKIVRTDDACRKVLADLTGKGRTRELDPKDVEKLNSDVIQCFPGGPHELKQNPEGKWVMMERGSVRFVWPKGAATVPAGPAAQESDMF